MTARIVFDLDGTLVDSLPDIAGAVNSMLAEVNRDALSLSTVCSFVGNGLPNLVGKVIDHCDMDMSQHAELTRMTLHHYNKRSSDLTVPYPGVCDSLATLQGAGFTLGLCTNKPEAPARHVLDALELAQFFDVVIGGDTFERRKPDPAPLHAAFDHLGDGPRLFVGDSEVDAETAQRAKVPFLLFTEGYRKNPIEQLAHTASYSNSADLPELVAQVLGEMTNTAPNGT